MMPSGARDLVMAESLGEDGVIVALRMGNDPGPERMRRLLAAVLTLFDDLRGDGAIDRELAHALHALAMNAGVQVTSWEARGLAWREALIAREVPALELAVESVFADERPEPLVSRPIGLD